VQQKENSEFWNPTCVIGGNKKKIKTSTKKKSAYITHPDFSAAKLGKKCANYASKYGI
jgi:hypothetical protein